MNVAELREKPIWQMTGAEFLFLQEHGNTKQADSVKIDSSDKKYVYGIGGIMILYLQRLVLWVYQYKFYQILSLLILENRHCLKRLFDL